MKTEKAKQSKACIYALLEPDTDRIRYIGKANNLRKRYEEHCRLSNNTGESPRQRWLRGLLDSGQRPGIKVLERQVDWEEAETRLIAYYRKEQSDLLNTADGGANPGHLNRASQKQPWAGMHTPLQYVQSCMITTIRSLERSEEGASKGQVLRLKYEYLQSRIATLKKTMGRRAALDYFNYALIRRNPHIFPEYQKFLPEVTA